MKHAARFTLLFALLLGTSCFSARACDVSYTFATSFTTSHFLSEFALDDGEVIINTSWDFGDGGTGTLPNPIHAYPF